MPTVDVECTECATVLPIEEDQLGTELKCPKCKALFLTEKAKGAYELVDPTPRQTSAKTERIHPNEEPEPEAPPETEAERKLRERMEKWADE